LVDAGSADFLTAFGDQFPAKSFAYVMGLPVEDTPFFVSCARRISAGVSSIGEKSDPVGAMNDIKAYYARVLADRRKAPRDPSSDFVTLLMDARIDDRPLDEEEFLDICMTLTFGSLDTTKSVLGWSFWHLATHPDDRRWVAEDPAIVPSAVEEFLRAYPIVSMARKLKEDVDFHGCPMKKDDMVLLAIQAATRDPDVFPNPEDVRLDRSPNRHIAFGASEHRCPGSHLARAELQLSLEQWHRQIPDYRIPDGAEVLAHGGQISLLTLPLVWDGPASR
jgi:cytochrome P450